MEQHSVFAQFPPMQVEVPDGMSCTYTGALYKDEFIGESSLAKRRVLTEIPEFDEEYFEWVTLLDSVLSCKSERYCMVELGAGWGRWLLSAAHAAALRGKPGLYVAVEGEPTHYGFLRQAFRINRLAGQKYRAVQAVVSGEPRDLWFEIGSAPDWYGQAIVEPSGERELREPMTRSERWRLWWKGIRQLDNGKTPTRVKSMSLSRILERLDCVDLIDMDIQGAEADVVEEELTPLKEKVKRLFIGTHSEQIERRLRESLGGSCWVCERDYHCGQENDTPYGQLHFQDGVQTWLNPSLE